MRSPAQDRRTEELRARSLYLWRTEPEMSAAAIARRLGVDKAVVLRAVHDALAAGQVLRAPYKGGRGER